MEMDIDDDADVSSAGVMNGYGSGSGSGIPIKPKRKGSFASYSHSSLSGATAAQYGSALESAVAYGQELQSDYKDHPEVRAIFKRTSVIMAFEDPLGAGGDAAEVAGQAARINLATEVNQAILRQLNFVDVTWYIRSLVPHRITRAACSSGLGEDLPPDCNVPHSACSHGQWGSCFCGHAQGIPRRMILFRHP
jgi:hypothetical protein